MRVKKSLYPKTKRVSSKEFNYVLTEKLDGSNIGFFKMDDKLVVAQRKNVFIIDDLEEIKQALYKGLYQWILDNGEALLQSLNNNSGFFGEWIGMGKLKYECLDKRVYMFCKANILDDITVKNINYDQDLFIHPFIDQVIPDFIGVVPVVEKLTDRPTIADLNQIYSDYSLYVDRSVEGFVLFDGNGINKYVRMKNGTLSDHVEEVIYIKGVK